MPPKRNQPGRDRRTKGIAAQKAEATRDETPELTDYASDGGDTPHTPITPPITPGRPLATGRSGIADKNAERERLRRSVTPQPISNRPARQNLRPELESSSVALPSSDSPVPPQSYYRSPITDEHDVATDDENDFYQPRPAYVEHTYKYIQDRLWELVGLQTAPPQEGDGNNNKNISKAGSGLIAEFAAKHFSFQDLIDDGDSEAVLAQLRKMDFHAAQLVGYVATGGPNGVEGWLDLFRDPLERQALVCGIIGTVLQEYVFGSTCFGATPEQLRALHVDIDIKYRDQPEDGFTRTQRRHERIREILAASDDPHGLPPHFLGTSKLLAYQLYTMLEPIRALARDYVSPSPTSATSKRGRAKAARTHHPDDDAVSQCAAALRELFTIVVRAGLLAVQTRLDPHAVYFTAPAAKDEFWLERDMRSFNRRRMVDTNPALNAAAELDGSVERERRAQAAQCQLALVRMTLFPALKVYRRGGWRAADKRMGVRECQLGRQWVSLRWGEQRKWKDDEPGQKWEEWLVIWAEGSEDRLALPEVKDLLPPSTARGD